MKLLRSKWLVVTLVLVFLLAGCNPAPNEEQVKKIADLEAQITTKDNKISELDARILELEAEANASSATLLQTSLNVMQALEDKDMTTLASYVHPTLGLRFSPYYYINIATDLNFAATALPTLLTDPTIYTWGSYQGSGDPISYKFSDYYDEFVYDEDYLNPHLIGNNTTIGTGNLINNISIEYPTASFVEFHFTGFDPQYAGMDWTSLTLMFENVSGNWMLVGIVHSQWTS